MSKKIWLPRSFFILFIVNALLRITRIKFHGISIGWKSWIKSEIEFGYLSRTGWSMSVKGSGRFTVGRYCAIGERLTVITSNHDMRSPIISYRLQEQLFGFRKVSKMAVDVHVENDVWIGDNVTLLPGIQVGNGSIIGAGAVVSKNVEPFSIVAGNPAKIIGMRFSYNEIEYLNKIKWWELDMDQLKSNRHYFDYFDKYSS